MSFVLYNFPCPLHSYSWVAVHRTSAVTLGGCVIYTVRSNRQPCYHTSVASLFL